MICSKKSAESIIILQELSPWDEFAYRTIGAAVVYLIEDYPFNPRSKQVIYWDGIVFRIDASF